MPTAPDRAGPRTLVESGYLRLSLADGGSETLVVSLTGIGKKVAGMLPDEFVGIAWAGGRNTSIFISDLRRTWYNDTRVLSESVDHIRRIADRLRPRRIVAIGNSMGGFGAIVLSSLMEISTVISFVPQYSVDRDLMRDDPRWQGWRVRLPAMVYRTAGEYFVPRTNYYTFHGSGPLDNLHTRLFPIRGNVHSFVFPRLRHNLAAVLKENGHLAPLIQLCMESGVEDVSGFVARHYGADLRPRADKWLKA